MRVPSKELGMPAIVKHAAGYAVAALVSLLLLIGVQRLWRADLSVPFNYMGDAIANQLLIKGVIEHGWYLHNDAIGMPGGGDFHDHPMVDNLHFGVMKLISFFTGNHVLVFNLYYILTFPLTTLAALLVFRRYGLSYTVALAGSLLYTFLPYHFWRGEVHLLLAAYYTIPLMVLLLLWLCSGEAVFCRWDEQRGRLCWHLLSWRAGASLAICALIACSGVYYAFFGFCLVFVAGAFSFLTYKKATSLWNALGCAGIIAGVVFAQLAPTFLYHWEFGPNPQAMQRLRSDPETYALKIVQLLLPPTGHRIGLVARWKSLYNTKFPVNENDSAAMGLLASIGFALLIGRLLCRKALGKQPGLADSLSILNLFAVLLATVGGFGVILSFVIGPSIRAYNRISVYIAFFSLFALLLALERLKLNLSRSSGTRLVGSALPLLCLGLGILDQTTRYQTPPYQSIKQEYQRDKEFVKRIEAALPSQAMVFELPYSPFPEGPLYTHHMFVYDPARPYLHSKQLRWSYGAMHGREADQWQQAITALPAPAFLDAIVDKGFLGLYIDREAYPDHAAALESELVKRLNTCPQLSANQRLSFFDLQAYAAARTASAKEALVAR
jgi:uncharacterized membrane protein (Fun14 family)